MQTITLEAAFAIALELPGEDRCKLADLIHESLPEDSEEREYDPAVVAEWNRRLDDDRAGRTQAAPADKVLAK